MTIAAAEPSSARILRKRANSSTIKLPPKIVSLPAGMNATRTPATNNSTIAAPSTNSLARAGRLAPISKSAIAPSPSTSSGNSGKRFGICAAFITSPCQSGAVQRANRMLIIVDELHHRSRRNVEHELRIDAEDDCQNDERRHDRDFAPADVLYGEQGRFFQLAEDDLAIKPKRVSGRENRAERRERRYPIVDAEGADEAEELADKS